MTKRQLRTRGRSAVEAAVLGFLARTLVSGLVAGPQRTRRDQLASLMPPAGSIVLLGDSITEGGEWEELLSGLPVVNRGISGETSSQVLERLSTAISRPVAIVLLIGTNDLSVGTPRPRVADSVAHILDEIQRLAPGVPVILQSVMPRGARLAAEVRDLNTRYKALADTRPEVAYLDLWPALADGDAMCSDFSFDRVHLNGAGYRAWVSVLRPALEWVLREQTARSASNRISRPVP